MGPDRSKTDPKPCYSSAQNNAYELATVTLRRNILASVPLIPRKHPHLGGVYPECFHILMAAADVTPGRFRIVAGQQGSTRGPGHQLARTSETQCKKKPGTRDVRDQAKSQLFGVGPLVFFDESLIALLTQRR